MSAKNAESLKQTLTIWHKRKLSYENALTQIEYDFHLYRITLIEGANLVQWLHKLYEAK